MERQVVESSNLASMGYDADEQMLEIEFKKGAIYRYYEVPLSVYEEVLESESVGKAFVNLVRGGGFTYKRVGK